MHRAGGASRTAKLVSNRRLPRQCPCYGEANGAASQELRRVSQKAHCCTGHSSMYVCRLDECSRKCMLYV